MTLMLLVMTVGVVYHGAEVCCFAKKQIRQRESRLNMYADKQGGGVAFPRHDDFQMREM